jgi:hypothetical protein
MRLARFFALPIGLLLLCSSALPINDLLAKRIEKKLKKEVKAVFALEHFALNDSAINIPTGPFLLNQNMKEITVDQELKGYAFLGTAPSKTDTFEYLILFDPSFTIKKAAVLIYREDYGGEIASKRWLSQFVKEQDSPSFEFGNNISAISGATISVQSMTASVNHVFASLKNKEFSKEN